MPKLEVRVKSRRKTEYGVKHSQWGDVWRRLRKNKLAMVGMVIALLLVFVSVFANVITPYAFDEMDAANRFLFPSLKHLCGTDNYGRDIFTRLLYGGRTSLLVAVLALIISTAIGIFLGVVAGYTGGWVETIIMRVMDIFMSIPGVLLAVSISSALGTGILPTALAVGISSVPGSVRLLRGQILTERKQEYVEAAVAAGASRFRVMFQEVFPNCLSPLIVQVSLSIGMNITTISGLSFIGLGVQPPIAEWGNMMTTGLSYIREFWPLATFPGVMIMLALFAFNNFGDGLRDAMDPKLKK